MKFDNFLNSKKSHFLLLPILILAVYLRINHQWLLPYFYNTDEYFVIKPSLYILQTGSLNPQVFKYGSFMYYMTALVYWVYFHLYSSLYKISFNSLINQLTDATPLLYVIGRCESCFFDLLNIIMSYSISNQIFNRKSAAIFSALLMAFNPLTIYMAHMSKVDTALTLFVLLSFYIALRIKQDGKLRYIVSAGIFAGLAMATKYDFIALLPPLVAEYFYYKRHKTHVFSMIILLIAIAALTFFLASPFTFLDLHGFVMDLRSESAQQGLSLSTLDWVHTRFIYQIIVQLPFSLSISVYMFFILGLLSFKTFFDNETFILYLSYPLSYFILSTLISASISQIIFSHLYLTILPFIIMFSSTVAVHFISKIKLRFLKYGIMMIILIDVCIASSNFKNMFLPYQEAAQWLKSVEPPQTVRLSYITPFYFSPGSNYAVDEIQPSPFMLKQLSTFHPQIVLVSEGWYKTYFYNRETYYSQPIDTILSKMGYKMVKEFKSSSVYIDLFEHIDNAIDVGTIKIFINKKILL